MTRKKRRMYMVGGRLVVLFAAAWLVTDALKENLVFFHSPSDIQAKPPAQEQRIRLGGLVEAGSRREGADGVVLFRVTDGAHAIEVSYKGILPNLFREGQGVVTEGHLRGDGSFRAAEVLAKHDENYMPREVADALKKSGHWKETGKAEK